MHSKGIILIELLIVLGVSLLLSLALAVIGRAAFVLYRTGKSSYENAYAMLRLQHLLQQVTDDLDSHPFLIFPRVHAAGRISFPDGRPHPVLAGARVPDAGSDALTAIALDLESAQTVLNEEEPLSFFACPRFNKRLVKDEYFGFVGISADGMWELHGEVNPHAGRFECMDLKLRHVPGMSLSVQDGEPAAIRILVPIVRHYTLYLDEEEQLRYLSHGEGADWRENQPLFKGVRRLRLKTGSALGGAAWCISAEAVLHNGVRRRAASCARFGRSEHFNFLLNRP